MHVLILGAKSFIGSRLAGYFCKNTEWDIESVGSAEIDLTDDSSIDQLRKKITPHTSVIFLSTISRLRDDSIDSFQKNISMATNVALALSPIKYHNLIFCSSIDVYGRPPKANPITEDSPVNPFGYYGLSKYVSEKILINELQGCGPLAILRLPGVYALDEADSSALGTIYNNIRKNKPITLSGGGKHSRSYLNVYELASLMENITHKKWSGLLNASFSKALPLIQAATELKCLLGSDSKIVNGPENGTEFDIVIDTSKLLSEFPEVPVIPLRQQIKNQHNLYQSDACHAV